MWSCGMHFSTFYLTCPLCSLSISCVYVYVCISVSLSFISPSLWKSLSAFLSVLFSFNFYLTHPSFSSLYISLTCSPSPGFFFQLSLFFQLGEDWESYLYTVLYLTSSVTTANSQVQFSSGAQSYLTLRPHESQHARPPCPSISRSSLRLMSIESVIPSSHLILYHPLLLLPPIPPSIRVFFH